MSINNWQYSYRRIKLFESERSIRESNSISGVFGFVYAVKIPVTRTFSLLKIGTTHSLQSRLTGNFPANTIYATSPAHYNYFENEGLLHDFFAKYRVPPRRGSWPELFNISLPFFLEHLPDLCYETDISHCHVVEYLGECEMPIYYRNKTEQTDLQ